MGEPASASNAKVLLDEAKQHQQERKRAAMQKELDRMGEDVKKGKQEIVDLEQSISKVGSAVTDTKAGLDRLAGRKKNVTQDLELLNLRTEAERLKAEGLSLLNGAHAKALDALTKRNEELDLRTAVVSAEIQKLSESGKAVESESKGEKRGSSPTLAELRRNLDKAESRSSLADGRAREAMEAASRKLHQAEAAAAKVEKRQAEFEAEKNGITAGGGDAPKPKAKNVH